ncbi:hypothetical protein CC2G_006839 [Coprinopsis cinerea AmutBmut pab1-1]|nr:hypothetical protein CC2G_006839 [Coprinopsis cinerea AmutBmut pab1-1]
MAHFFTQNRTLTAAKAVADSTAVSRSSYSANKVCDNPSCKAKPDSCHVAPRGRGCLPCNLALQPCSFVTDYIVQRLGLECGLQPDDAIAFLEDRYKPHVTAQKSPGNPAAKIPDFSTADTFQSIIDEEESRHRQLLSRLQSMRRSLYQDLVLRCEDQGQTQSYIAHLTYVLLRAKALVAELKQRLDYGNSHTPVTKKFLDDAEHLFNVSLHSSAFLPDVSVRDTDV